MVNFVGCCVGVLQRPSRALTHHEESYQALARGGRAATAPTQLAGRAVLTPPPRASVVCALSAEPGHASGPGARGRPTSRAWGWERRWWRCVALCGVWLLRVGEAESRGEAVGPRIARQISVIENRNGGTRMTFEPCLNQNDVYN